MPEFAAERAVLGGIEPAVIVIVVAEGAKVAGEGQGPPPGFSKRAALEAGEEFESGDAEDAQGSFGAGGEEERGTDGEGGEG